METNIFDVVAEVLLNKDKYVAEDGTLLKAIVYSDIMTMDEELIEILIENRKIKDTFFVDINETLVFDKQKFAWFIDSKNFLPDSFTSYTNKIGLTKDGEFISSKNDVVLDFPYKDCVLEGGQDKEDQKREEIFYHELIAQDEITRMLEPKVFTNAKRYTANGIKENIEFNDEDNLIIKGNNLIALASLLKRYKGKVKCIYIDPPYNTGNDSFGYNDSFNQSTWLTFMKNRLELARELLSEDGSIYVQIDNNEVHYLKVIMDEVFGKSNFQREIIWSLNTSSGYKTLANNWVRSHDTILFYSKTNNFEFNKLYTDYSDEYKKRFRKKDKDGRLYRDDRGSGVKQYLDELKGIPMGDVWNDIMSFQQASTSKEFLGFVTQKPEKLLKRIILASTDVNEIVLDFNLGSGTTAAVAHKMRRRYIGIEQMSYIDDVTLERLKKVIDGEQNGVSKDVNWEGGGSFVYCELKEDGKSLISEIENATGENIKEIKEKIYYDDRIVPYIMNKELKEIDKEFDNLTLENKKKSLIRLVDKNKLYVNYSDIDDENINIRDDERKFTSSFYEEDLNE